MSARLEHLMGTRGVYLLIPTLALACYWSGLTPSWFLYDDDQFLYPYWPGWESASGLVWIWTHDIVMDAHYRPIADTVWWLVHQLWGEWEVGYRLLNLSLHLGAVFWAIALFRRLRVPRP